MRGLTLSLPVRLIGECRPENVGGVQGHHAGLEEARLGLFWEDGGGEDIC